VLAAASLTEAVTALAADFSDARVLTSFGSSSALARQIRDGAPADVYLSASADWMDFLREAGALAGPPLEIARNRLVSIAPRDGRLARRGVRDPSALRDALEPGASLAIADQGVPAGEYARSALSHLHLLDALRPRLVGQRDVRAVLHAVERGELAAGFTYATDARVADVAVLFAFDPATHPPIVYAAAALRGAARPETARRFLHFLQGANARLRLADAGFVTPNPAP
jgi:molybdate transport system substrate-binding protein